MAVAVLAAPEAAAGQEQVVLPPAPVVPAEALPAQPEVVLQEVEAGRLSQEIHELQKVSAEDSAVAGLLEKCPLPKR